MGLFTSGVLKPYHRFGGAKFSKNVSSLQLRLMMKNVCVWMITDWSQTQQAAGVFIRNTDSPYTN